MDQILQQIGSTIGGFFGHPLIQIAFRGVAVYIIVLWLAAAYWAFRDLQGRTDNPIAPYLAASLIILFTPIFFPLAIIVYRIIRPHEQIGEVTERSLAEEALLNEVESVPHCPGCSRRVDAEWLVCPTCRTRLQRVCPNCSRLVGPDWLLCAWCGQDFDRRDRAAVETAPSGSPSVARGPSRKGVAPRSVTRPAPDSLTER